MDAKVVPLTLTEQAPCTKENVVAHVEEIATLVRRGSPKGKRVVGLFTAVVYEDDLIYTHLTGRVMYPQLIAVVDHNLHGWNTQILNAHIQKQLDEGAGDEAGQKLRRALEEGI